MLSTQRYSYCQFLYTKSEPLSRLRYYTQKIKNHVVKIIYFLKSNVVLFN